MWFAIGGHKHIPMAPPNRTAASTLREGRRSRRDHRIPVRAAVERPTEDGATDGLILILGRVGPVAITHRLGDPQAGPRASWTACRLTDSGHSKRDRGPRLRLLQHLRRSEVSQHVGVVTCMHFADYPTN